MRNLVKESNQINKQAEYQAQWNRAWSEAKKRMPHCLEEYELVVGNTYRCETYLHHELLLKYLGNGDFERLQGLTYLDVKILSLASVGGVVIHVFERV